MKSQNAFARQLFGGSRNAGQHVLPTQIRTYRKDLSYKQPKFAETDQKLHNHLGKLVVDRLTDDQKEFKYAQTRGTVESFLGWLKTDPDTFDFDKVDEGLVERYTTVKKAYFRQLHDERKEQRKMRARWIERRNEALRALPPRLRFVALTQSWPGWAEKLPVPVEFPPAYDPADVFQQPPWVRSTQEALGITIEGASTEDKEEQTFDVSEDYQARHGDSTLDDTDLFGKYGDLEVMKRLKGEWVPPPPVKEKAKAAFVVEQQRGPPQIDSKAKRINAWITGGTDLKTGDSLDTILEGAELTRPQLADRGDTNRQGQFIPEGRSVENFEEEVFEDVKQIFKDEAKAKSYIESMNDPDKGVFESEMAKRKGKK